MKTKLLFERNRMKADATAKAEADEKD